MADKKPDPSSNVTIHPASTDIPSIFRYYDLLKVPVRPELITREIARKALITFAGDGGGGKSYISAENGVAIVLGDGEFGRNNPKPEKGRILYVDNENGEDLFMARLHALLRGRGLNPFDTKVLDNRFKVIDGRAAGFDLDNDDHLNDLYREIRKFHPDVVFLDSYMAMMSRTDGNVNIEVRRLLDVRVRFLQGDGAAIVGITHARKRTGKRELDAGSQGVMGARAWIDGVDEAFIYRPISDDRTTIRVSVEDGKGRIYGKEQPFVLAMTLPPRGTLVGDMVSTIRDLGEPNKSLPAKDSIPIYLRSVLTTNGPQDPGELDKLVAERSESSPSWVKQVRLEIMRREDSFLVHVEQDSGRHPLIGLKESEIRGESDG